ncbi:hypothetical protein F4802DRAFT_154214 [Xylaria palmicola]|nr:hypothetical protein F4802DRAFT_154214 [Xylaria palmicola]
MEGQRFGRSGRCAGCLLAVESGYCVVSDTYQSIYVQGSSWWWVPSPRQGGGDGKNGRNNGSEEPRGKPSPSTDNSEFWSALSGDDCSTGSELACRGHPTAAGLAGFRHPVRRRIEEAGKRWEKKRVLGTCDQQPMSNAYQNVCMPVLHASLPPFAYISERYFHASPHPFGK